MRGIPLQYVSREVLVLEDIVKPPLDVRPVYDDFACRHVGGGEGNLVKYPLHDGMEPPCPDVLHPFVNLRRYGRYLPHGVVRVLDLHALSLEELLVLLQERVPRLRKDPDEGA